MDRVCENCAHPDDDLALVHRVYVDPEQAGTAAARQIVDDPELWCVSCRSQYPFEPVEDDTDDLAP